MSKRNKQEFYQQASLSQKLSYRRPEYQDYAGADPEISEQIAMIKTMMKHGFIEADKNGVPLDKDLQFHLDLLNERRKAAFATSIKVNEITKMGLQMPKREEEFGADDEDEDEDADA